MERTALVVGVTGIVGSGIAEALVADCWNVVGLSRGTTLRLPGVEHVSADVLDESSVETAIAGRGITHLFYSTWSMQPTEAENCAVNGAMIGNTLRAAGRASQLQHAVLITGLKHYLGPFESYGKNPHDTPFRESQGRLPFQNFYYDQEDILFAAAAEQGFTWSVHRPSTVIGHALGNAMNMGVTLAVYGSICRATGAPFVFPGSPEQYNSLTDITDSRLLGRHAVWSATEPAARNEAFNSVNGDVFRWRHMWGVVADALGVEPADYPGHPTPLQHGMDHADDVWATLVAAHGLADHRASELASWWHTDADLGRELETVTDMSKSRALGFLDYQDSRRSFTDLFDRLRLDRVIPPL